MHDSSPSSHKHSSISSASWSRHEERTALKKALWITIAFMFVEFVGGWMANSLALLADAIHMLTDAGSILVSFFAFWIAQRPATPSLSYGYRRAEILGALINGLSIWLLCGFLIYEAVARIFNPPHVKGPIVFVIAAVGLVINLLVMKILHPTQSRNLNIRSAYLHVFGDLLGSVAALIAGAVIWLTDWWLIDPIVTVFFSLIILYSSWHMVKETIHVLMESTPSHLNPLNIKADLEAIPFVEEVHDLHIWTITSNYPALSAHILTKNGDAVLADAHHLLKEKYHILHSTIQVEHPDKFQSEYCYECSQRPNA